MSRFPNAVYEGLALFEGIHVQNTSQLVDICIPFCPTDVYGHIDASDPFIKQMPFCSFDNIKPTWGFDGILCLQLTRVTPAVRHLKVNPLWFPKSTIF